MCVGLIYIVFGWFGKFCAVFITIPYPVLGGIFVIVSGMLFGVVIGNLQVWQLKDVYMKTHLYTNTFFLFVLSFLLFVTLDAIHKYFY